jgi:hypothetical protein
MRLTSSPLAAGLFLVGACSLINAPDDVKPELVASAGSSQGANGGSGATGATGGTDAVAGDGSMPVGGDRGAAGSDMGSGGEDPGADPGPGPNPTSGMLVLATKDDKNARYLAVINSRTGKELLSEPLPVAAIAYDEAPLRHAWFVFTASSYPASPTGAADLEVRRFNDATGKWFVVSRTTALPPPEPDQLVVLNDRLVYLSHRVASGKAVSALTVLDTSDLTDIKELTSRNAAAGETYVGVVGDRGSDVNAMATGGRLRLMIASDCGNDCALSAQQIFVGANLTDGTTLALDRFLGQPRFVKARQADVLYAAIRTSNPDRLAIRSYTGPDLKSPTVATLTGFAGKDVGGFALSECATGGAVTDVTNSKLIAFHLESGTEQTVLLPGPGGPLYTELFGPSIISLDTTAAPGLAAYEVAKAGATTIALNARSIFKPDSTHIPLTGATRRGEAFKCP